MNMNKYALVLLPFLLIACGPAPIKPLENVGPNETAFVIPLEGDVAEQKKVNSVEYLNSTKVMAKRIEIPIRQRTTGRGPGAYEWVPTVRVIKVDRSLVTREWTSMDPKSVTAIAVESSESINFHVGVNLTATILEEDAATYLYYHTTATLAAVIDTNVRGFLQGELSKEFGSRPLEKCKEDKGTIFLEIEKRAKEHFKKYGITIQYVGNANGLSYDDPKIQDAINEVASSRMKVQVAIQEKAAADERNKTLLASAENETKIAREFEKTLTVRQAQFQMQLEKMRAEAMIEAAKHLPANILPAGSGLLMGLDVPKVPTAK
jgi:hypothetical protein